MSRFISINLLVFILIFISLSCNSSSKKSVINMSDITPHSEREDKGNVKEDNSKAFDYGFDIKLADEIGVQVMEIDSISEPLFPDRFSPKKIKKLTLHLKENPIAYCHWTFKDSIHTKNALYNWIDCYGSNCKSIKYAQKINFQKDNFILLESDTSLTYISSPSKLIADDWLNYFELQTEIKDWKLMIYQGTRGKATWYSVIEGKKEPLKLTK